MSCGKEQHGLLNDILTRRQRRCYAEVMWTALNYASALLVTKEVLTKKYEPRSMNKKTMNKEGVETVRFYSLSRLDHGDESLGSFHLIYVSVNVSTVWF